MVVAASVLVDEHKVVDALGLLLRAAFPVAVAQRREGEHESGEPLLAIDHEPALHAMRR